MKRALSLLLVLGILLGMAPIAALALEETAVNELNGKKLSVLGASISTYTGISNNADDNSTIGKNAVYYTAGRHGVYADDTWWMQAANDLGLELLVNNSWSGSALLHERSGTVGAYVNRCVQLHNNQGEEPDIIAIQMGTNDFQYYKDTLGTADIDYNTLIQANSDGTYTYSTPVTSLEAAAIVLHKISVRYPNAEVYYLNVSQRIDNTDALIRFFNTELKQVVEHFGASVVDIYGSAITMECFDTYIGDGKAHPNKMGMDAYTEAFKRAVVANTNYALTTHTVGLQLDNVTADYGDDKIVVSGDSYTLNLTASDQLKVTVTMDGKDITASVYSDGKVNIPAVTGDVIITANAFHQPTDYLWEFNGTDLSGKNALTKLSGTTTNGIFSNTCYALEQEVVLCHDQPWAVEWCCEGTFQNSGSSTGARVFTSTHVNAEYNARYIFKSNKNGIVAMGEKTATGSHNYGIALENHGIDWTIKHTYRLENRIADDGSNMVYLFVDGVEIGAMNHYYVGTTDKNTTSDWISGKDFRFSHMGTDTHGFTNAAIEYIAVNEAVHTHTYKNGTCTGCGAEDPDGLSLEGLNVLCLGDSITAGQGLTTATRWTNVLASKYNWNLTNKSQGGISLSSYYYTANGQTDVSIAKKAEVLKTMAVKPDVIIVWGGHNDTSYRYSPLGTWNDETTDSFKGALKYIAKLAEDYAPDATLFVLTPLWVNEKPSALKVPANTSDNNWMFVDAIYEGAEKYGWIPINMDLCGITPFTKSGLLLDNIHPNEAGTEKIVDYLSEELACYGENSKKNTILFNKSDVSMKTGESTTLKAVLSPRSGNSTPAFTWNSSDPSVATVDAGGKITAAAHGNAIITATAGNGTSATVSVTVDRDDHTYENGICTGCGAAQPGPVITQQPVDGKAKMGETYCVIVEAKGEGLKYTWYGRDAGATTWFKSGVTDNTYDDVMTATRADREVYCVITDAHGNSVTTDTVKLVLLPTYIWEQWTQPVTMAAGTYPTYGGSTTGYYSKGQTFGGILYSSTMRDGRDVLWNLNSSTYYSAVANPASLLYTTDYRGRVFNESAWAGSVCSTTALKACGYAYPYTTAEIQMKFDEKTDHSIDALAFGDILWTKGHVAGIIGVIKGDDGHVTSVKIIEQASYVRVFEITAQNWDTYFSGHWTHIYRGDFDATKTAPEDYPENLSIIFERGNNTYVTDYETMPFYIPTATTVYVTKNGVTASYGKNAFPTHTVNGVTVYDLASVFTGIGDYYFHTEENETDICIKVISEGNITVSGTTATLSGYENCEILGYRVIKVLDESKSSSYNFWEAPEGYTTEAVSLSFQWLDKASFEIQNIPENAAGWKLEVYYDTGYGWARSLSCDIIYGEEPHTHAYTTTLTPPTCTEQGYTTYTCECGDSYVADYVEATGEHTYENGICTGCGWADPDAAQPMSLRYDDHYDVTGKALEIIDAGTPTSFQVGYGVEENTVPDTAVVTLEGNTLVATGIGTAKVKIGGELYEITVTAAPISLLLVIGQSNAEGMVGNANQSVACENGQVYSTYAKADGLTGDAGLTVENAGNYVPSALTGQYSTVNVNGTDTKLSGYPVNSLTEAGNGKYGMDSGLTYEWIRQTGEKVWIINAAHGASGISSWQPGQSNFEEANALMDACQEVLLREIAAGHYTFSHMGYYWCQGCADETKTAQWYAEQYIAMHSALKSEMAFDGDLNSATPDSTLEFGGIILVMAGHENASGYRKGSYSDSSEKFFSTFKELEMRGPRVAQIWMANNPELPDIHLVCTLAQDWVTMPDGSDGVAEYFNSHYENGKIDYPTQVKQSASWYTPTTPAAVKNSIHYYQTGYNEVGRESVRNTLYILGLAEKPDVETTVTFVDWTGYQIADTIKTSAAASSGTLVVPMVSPCYESKNVTYALSDDLIYSYYDLLDSGANGGTLTASIGNRSVRVIGRDYYAYRFELVNGSMVSVSDSTFRENSLTQYAGQKVFTTAEPILLKHNKPWTVEFNSVASGRFMAMATAPSATEGMFYFFKSASNSGVLSIGEYKDGLYQNYGLLQHKIKIDWDQPHVYRFRNIINEDGTNTVHIYIDGVWICTATELIIDGASKGTGNHYLSGKDFAFTSIGCGGFGLSTGQMTYLEVWEDSHIHTYSPIVTAPTCTEQGYTTYTCACGDSYVADYTDPRPLNILMIGNSFSWDAADFWYDMQTSMTYDAMKRMLADPYDVHLAVMYKGSATLAYHATCAMKNTSAYTYTEIGPETNYQWTPSGGTNATNNILDQLEARDWDIIVIQSYQHEADGTEPRSTYTGGDARFTEPEASVGYLLDYFAEHEPNSDVYYYMPWATTKFYGSDTETGYHAMAKYTETTVPNLTGTNSGKSFAGIIPVGTGIQNARTTYFDALRFSSGTGSTALLKDPQNGLQYDSQHLSFGLGRYIAGIIVAETLIPQEMRRDSYVLPTVKDSPAVGELPQEYSLIGQLAAKYALRDPFKLTTLADYDTELADRVCDAIKTADYSANGIAGEADLQTHVETVVSEKLENMGAAEYSVTIHSFTLENGQIADMEATVTLRVGYTSRSVEIIVTNGMAHPFGEWEIISVPSAEGPGSNRRVCEICGFVEEVAVDGSWQKFALAEHLQMLPDDFCSETNLWDLLKPEKLMINHLGEWVSAGSSVYSVTIPVKPGEKIYANSFDQTDGRKGIQVSFIGDYGIVKTTFSSETYNEFQANGGYLIAPEGAIAVNIPVWNVYADDNTINILNYEHTYRTAITSPTCTERGYTTYTCTCGDSYVDDYVDATGTHTYEHGTCTGCGRAQPGDLNGDGKWNNKDVTRLMQYLAGWDVETAVPPDINGDGKLNNKDVTRLMQYLAGWDVEIH